MSLGIGPVETHAHQTPFETPHSLMSQPQSQSDTDPSTDTESSVTPITEEDTIKLGSIGTTTGTIPTTVNDFTAIRTSMSTAVYEDEQSNTVTISHSKNGQHNRRREYKLSLRNPAGETIGRAVIKYGSYTDRGIDDATSAVETQLWEWARNNVSDRYPIHQKIERLGEPNPHPPGERPGTSNACYYEFSQRQTETNDPDSMYGSYVQHSRYTFKATNSDRQWYCGTLNVSFNHEAPDSVETLDDCVYGAYVYLSLTPLKPVGERINKHDTREINRHCLHHDESHTALSHEDLIEIINDGVEQLRADAEAINDPERNAIIEEENRRLNEETGEYEEQTNLSGF